TLRPHGEAMLGVILDQARRTQNWMFQTNVHRALAAAAAGPGGGTDPGLALWHPSGYSQAWAHFTGSAADWWVAEDGLVAHVTGPEEDFLTFDAPLTGTFEFSVDAYDAPWSESQLSYGGLTFEVTNPTQPSTVPTVGRASNLPKPFHFL